MEMFSDPSKIHSLSMADKMAGSAVTLVMGMGITFIILVLLWGVILLMGKILKIGTSKKSAPAEVSGPVSAQASAPAAAQETVRNDDTLIAVIAAGIAAAEGSASAEHLVVRKIKRISGPSTVWGEAGRSECIDSRRM